MLRTITTLTLIGMSMLAVAQPKPDFVVARDGSGDFRNLQQAIDAVRSYRPPTQGPTVIFVKSGTYKEKIVVGSTKTNLHIVGEQAESTIITYDDHANIDKMGTFKTYTMQVCADDFRMENITIENNAAPLGQAVALHIDCDRAVFVNCRLLGNQDTLFTGGELNRGYFKGCYIEGTTDFIFGPATVWFEQCTIHSKKNSYITAASTAADRPYGYVFSKCRLTAAPEVSKVYLGRPWRPYAATVFIDCTMGSHILPAGWDNWRNPDNEKTARYAEYDSVGQGANSGARVGWSRQLSEKEAATYTIENVMKLEHRWIPK